MLETLVVYSLLGSFAAYWMFRKYTRVTPDLREPIPLLLHKSTQTDLYPPLLNQEPLDDDMEIVGLLHQVSDSGSSSPLILDDYLKTLDVVSSNEIE